MSFTIIQDTREQKPWDFDFYDTKGVVIQTLKEGDYTTQEVLKYEQETGEKIFRVERKRNTGEFATNIGLKKKAFFAELERLSEYEFPFLVFEFTVDKVLDFPKGSGIPKKYNKRIKISSKYMYSTIKKIQSIYGIGVYYCDGPEAARNKFIDLAEMVHDACKEKLSG